LKLTMILSPSSIIPKSPIARPALRCSLSLIVSANLPRTFLTNRSSFHSYGQLGGPHTHEQYPVTHPASCPLAPHSHREPVIFLAWLASRAPSPPSTRPFGGPPSDSVYHQCDLTGNAC